MKIFKILLLIQNRRIKNTFIILFPMIFFKFLIKIFSESTVNNIKNNKILMLFYYKFM